MSYSVEGPVPMSGAVITNHLNYTDILVHAAIRPCVFVSKIELRKVPVLGWVSMMAGTQYVERGAGGSAEKAAQGMAKGFRDGLPIVFFPEGTTGIGELPLLPFRSGLLAQALMAEQPITAGFLHYEISEEDLARGCSTMHDLHWGKQSLLAHLWTQLSIKSSHCNIRFAQAPIDFSPQAIKDRKLAAKEAHQAVLSLSEPIQPASGS
ncbi:MAG: lysophospholipid acyltransferase family protein [Acidobacteriaceae bacterium]|nr:lysophospholipid acyltransferase family protein [Acidobacteriaceae bacterium]